MHMFSSDPLFWKEKRLYLQVSVQRTIYLKKLGLVGRPEIGHPMAKGSEQVQRGTELNVPCHKRSHFYLTRINVNLLIGYAH